MNTTVRRSVTAYCQPDKVNARHRTVRLLLVWIGCGILFIQNCPGTSAAEDPVVAPLSDDERQAMRMIRQGSVNATVSFLASDEMAGRDTPSTELNIASAYVAARFRGAGLAGLGPEGTYYQTSSISQIAPPDAAAALTIDGQSHAVVSMLLGTDREVSTEGKLVLVGDADTQKYLGPVVVDDVLLPPQAVNNPSSALALWSRRIRPLAMQGATAVLIRVQPDSLLRQVADRLREKPVTLPEQFRFSCPVLLVDASIPTTGSAVLRVGPNREYSTPVHNVIGVLRGSDPELSKQAIIVSAHLDHIGLRGSGEDQINNGADDNATGVTAVLHLADAFGALHEAPRRSMIFMTFWGEEKGLLGSKYFVQNPLWPLDQVVANVNLEMIGRPEAAAEAKAWGTGWTHSDLGPLLAIGAKRAGVTIFHHEQFSEMLYTRSDNHSFVTAGVIAHSFSAGSLHSDYHQPSDEVEKLNLPHMTKVIEGLFAGILPIAQGQFTPKKTARP